MRIAVYHNLPSGGARRILHGLCRYLSANHTVDVFTLSTADQDLLRDADVAHSVQVLPYAQRRPIRMGLYLNDVRRLMDLADLERVNREGASRIDAGDYDVVFVEACRYTFAPALLRYLETPAAFYYNGSPAWLEGPSWKSPTTMGPTRRLVGLPFALQLERKLRKSDARHVRLADVVLTNSRHSRDRIMEAYGVRATICLPGVNLLPSGPSSEGDFVLSVGAIENRKGFDFLIDAIALVSPSRRPALVIAANGEDPIVRQRLEAQASRLGVDLRIRLNVTDAPLSALYLEALAFVYGSHDEPLGMAPLEAMAHGKAVVAVAEGGLPETVVDGVTGVLVPRDSAAFAASLEEVITSPHLRRTLGEGGRAEIERRWTWEARGPVYEQELQSLVSKAGFRQSIPFTKPRRAQANGPGAQP